MGMLYRTYIGNRIALSFSLLPIFRFINRTRIIVTFQSAIISSLYEFVIECDEFGSSIDLRVYSACNWNYEGKEEARKKGRINHKARLFRAMLMTPPASLARHQVSLFSAFFFFFPLKGQHTSLTRLQGIKHSYPDVQRGEQRERGPRWKQQPCSAV